MPAPRTLRVGTRGSALALTQTEAVVARLARAHPRLRFEICRIKTRGDRIKGDLTRKGGKGLFVKEIEDALLRKKVDLAVHSMKDLPHGIPKGLAIGAVPKREDPRDTLIFPGPAPPELDEVPQGARVATGSLRRALQLKSLRPDLRIIPVRGNVDTRLKHLDTGQYDAVALAVAGLVRLGLKSRIGLVFDPEVLIPAVGQGALGLEIRDNDTDTREIVRAVNHSESEERVFAERSFSSALGGTCNTPLAAYATLSRDKKTMSLSGLVAGPSSGRILRDRIEDWEDSPDALGEALAQLLIEAGAEEVLREAV